MELIDFLPAGYLGLFLASFLAATILPFSSELVLAGMLSLSFDPTRLLLVATTGNWLGGLTSYYIGYLGNWRWIETKLKVSKQKVEQIKAWVDKYGSVCAILCWLPFVGDPLAVTLGVFRTNVVAVGVYMLIGKFIRYWAVIYGASLIADGIIQ